MEWNVEFGGRADPLDVPPSFWIFFRFGFFSELPT
jgi:hypothetical protein